MSPRLTLQSLKVLRLLLKAHPHERTGAELMETSGCGGGTVYPILYRLADYGWLSSRWEPGDPVVKQRPLRHFYRLTETGLAEAKAVFKEIEA